MSKLERTIDILKRGWTTSLECAQQGGVMSLSQRVSLDLRPMMTFEYEGAWLVLKDVPRFDIEERWQTTSGGARYVQRDDDGVPRFVVAAWLCDDDTFSSRIPREDVA